MPDRTRIENPELREKEVQKFLEAHRNTVNFYQTRIAQTDTLPIEINDAVQAMLTSDLMILQSLCDENGSIIEAIKNGSNAGIAIYDALMPMNDYYKEITNPESHLYAPTNPYFGKHEY